MTSYTFQPTIQGHMVPTQPIGAHFSVEEVKSLEHLQRQYHMVAGGSTPAEMRRLSFLKWLVESGRFTR